MIGLWCCATPYNTSSVMAGWLGRPCSRWWCGINQTSSGSPPQMCHLTLFNEEPTNIIQCRDTSHFIDPPDGYSSSLTFCKTSLVVVAPSCPFYRFAARQVIVLPLPCQTSLSQWFLCIKSPDGYSQLEWKNKCPLCKLKLSQMTCKKLGLKSHCISRI